jgi:hypothetical protein
LEFQLYLEFEFQGMNQLTLTQSALLPPRDNSDSTAKALLGEFTNLQENASQSQISRSIPQLRKEDYSYVDASGAWISVCNFRDERFVGGDLKI